ncbi:hypothetical protein CB1_000849056 [Camelus ferus]|nr:hypothetical protein CB1_000849056 [Camelus ferus]
MRCNGRRFPCELLSMYMQSPLIYRDGETRVCACEQSGRPAEDGCAPESSRQTETFHPDRTCPMCEAGEQSDAVSLTLRTCVRGAGCASLHRQGCPAPCAVQPANPLDRLCLRAERRPDSGIRLQIVIAYDKARAKCVEREDETPWPSGQQQFALIPDLSAESFSIRSNVLSDIACAHVSVWFCICIQPVSPSTPPSRTAGGLLTGSLAADKCFSLDAETTPSLSQEGGGSSPSKAVLSPGASCLHLSDSPSPVVPTSGARLHTDTQPRKTPCMRKLLLIPSSHTQNFECNAGTAAAKCGVPVTTWLPSSSCISMREQGPSPRLQLLKHPPCSRRLHNSSKYKDDHCCGDAMIPSEPAWSF